MKKIILKIEGMTCSACSNGLEKYLNKQNGIISANVNLVMASAQIEYDEKIVNRKMLDLFVKKAGFKSLGEFDIKDEENKSKKDKILFILFGILALIVLYISMGHMLGLPISDFLNMEKSPVNYTIVLFILTIAFLIYGFDILKSGVKNLIHKTPNMDTLVTIGVLSSFLYSVYSMFMIIKGNNDYINQLYFESSAIVLFFIKLGRYLEGISKDRTKEAIKKLVQITPSKAIVKKEGIEKEVTIDEIKKGDIVVSHPGDRISVDGKIVFGKAHLDESFLTGESKPLNKKQGDRVIAGSVNYDGYIEYEAEKIGKDSNISQIVKLVLEASNTKPKIAKIADKVSGYFVPIVILIAIISFFTYILLGYNIGESLSTFVTILVVACPCSLGLATPLAVVVSEGRCAKEGILVRKSEILEIAEKVNTVVFDKTGTLTYGKLKIAKCINYSKNLKLEEILRIVGSIEAKSTHPIAGAFTNYLKEYKLGKYNVEEFKNISGLGIEGRVNGKKYILGNYKILEYYGIDKKQGNNFNEIKKEEIELAKKGNSIIYVLEEEKIIALIGVNDLVRENAKEIIKKLNKNNIEQIMLTGDNLDAAKIIGEEIGITKIIANVVPEEKTKIIKDLKKEGKKVLMCGDGINDSPALATADIGVSVNSGTDIALDSSDVILMKDDLSKIIDLITISKKTIKNIKQNLFWAFFYNVLMIPIAIGVLKPIGISINPMIAGLAMTLSSLTVILNALRLR